MINYCFFMTNQPHWFKVAKKLYSNNIAKPILWLGDDIHYDKAKLEFGDDAVVKMQDFVHRPYKFKDINRLLKSYGFIQIKKSKMLFRKSFEYIYENIKS